MNKKLEMAHRDNCNISYIFGDRAKALMKVEYVAGKIEVSNLQRQSRIIFQQYDTVRMCAYSRLLHASGEDVRQPSIT